MGRLIIFSVIALMATAGCGGGGGGGAASVSASVKLASNTAPASPSLSHSNKNSAGQVTAAGLTQLGYYIISISICEDMETNGTGFSNPTGCLDIYQGNPNDPTYAYDNVDALTQVDFQGFATAAASAGFAQGFINLMNDTQRAALTSNTTLTPSDARSYNWGYITWYLPVQVTAEIDMGSGVMFRTNNGPITLTDPAQGPVTNAAVDFSTATSASQAVVVLNNGGSWFRFQNPFVITEADIAAGTQYTVDLAFDPDALLTAYVTGVGGCGGCILRDPSNNQIRVPMLDLTPVPHSTDQNVLKQTYVAPIVSGTDNFSLRFELYSIEGDTNRTIYGINASTLVNTSTTTAAPAFPKVAFIEDGTLGTLTFQDYRGASGVLITGFQQLTDEGGSFSATIHCSDPSAGGFTFDGCTAGSTFNATFTLESNATLL